MAASQQHISPQTPLGASLVEGGATFRLWAPAATAVHVALHPTAAWQPSADTLLVKDGDYWAGFFPGVTDGTPFELWTSGPGGAGLKRDPRALELGPEYPHSPCYVRGPNTYPWHDAGFHARPFNELVIYQFHIGVFHAWDNGDIRKNRVSKFLDVVDRIEYLAALGVTAVQPLPVVEWQGTNSRGYNNTDFFSPEMDYCVEGAELQRYVPKVNRLLRARGQPELRTSDLVLQGNQLKAMVDLFHLHGIAVIFDVVYNHAGGPFDAESMRFLEWPSNHQWWDPDSYFIAGSGWAGGRIFDYTHPDVRQFIIDNARLMVDEYHGDGLRFDEVRVMRDNGGNAFCRDLTDTLHYHKPSVLLIAEDWSWDRAAAVTPTAEGGLGFDASLDDRFRNEVRAVLGAMTGGASARLDLDPLRDSLLRPTAFPSAWRTVTHLENHDLVDADRSNANDILPRIAALAHWDDRRDWLARSRSRLATTLLLTGPGIPMLFMGEEFLEDKPWHNDPARSDLFIYWDGLRTSGAMRDFLRFTSELLSLRQRYPALCGEGINPYFVHNDDRVLAYQRWIDGVGRDVIVVASFAEETRWDYTMPFPVGGRWREVFNSDAYDSLPADGGYNPWCAGNAWGVDASGTGVFGQPASARMVLPANSVVVLARA